MENILIGNAFPLVMVRRKVTVEPVSLETLKFQAAGKEICSFWGHNNSLESACEFTDLNLAADTERPEIHLSTEGYLLFDGQTFEECWIVSPNYINDYRPKIGEEVAIEKIESWQILKLTWES